MKQKKAITHTHTAKISLAPKFVRWAEIGPVFAGALMAKHSGPAAQKAKGQQYS